MATYVLLTKVSSQGIKTIQSNPRRIKEVNQEIEAQGARVIAQYATLGRYDFVNIVEAKDNETMARVSVSLGARGTVQIETLTAIPVEQFIRAVGTKKSRGR
ncbi:MAG TPA: GYD domain-containing protein [Candidatus Limnocylindria bacterium]|nr:GYD domain-containing protein [Candidatus Limnocylindria bacterium]